MKAETIIEVMEKLIGAVAPVGETHSDVKRLENQETLGKVLDYFAGKLKEIAMDADHHLGSVAEAGKLAKKQLEALTDFNED